jgi:hypothetical protein
MHRSNLQLYISAIAMEMARRDMMTMSSGMMVGMGVVWLLVIVFLILGIAAAIKYLRS